MTIGLSLEIVIFKKKHYEKSITNISIGIIVHLMWKKEDCDNCIITGKESFWIVCSQIKMNFFAQNLREVSANLVKNFDTVFF